MESPFPRRAAGAPVVARPIDSRDNGSRPVSRRRRDSHGVAICAIVAIADQ